MIGRFYICSVDVYDQAIKDGVVLEEDVKGYEPRYSPDKTEVLVTGIGEMTVDDVIKYISENWIYPDEI